jgi:hypothetical protein
LTIYYLFLAKLQERNEEEKHSTMVMQMHAQKLVTKEEFGNKRIWNLVTTVEIKHLVSFVLPE